MYDLSQCKRIWCIACLGGDPVQGWLLASHPFLISSKTHCGDPTHCIYMQMSARLSFTRKGQQNSPLFRWPSFAKIYTLQGMITIWMIGKNNEWNQRNERLQAYPVNSPHYWNVHCWGLGFCSHWMVIAASIPGSDSRSVFVRTLADYQDLRYQKQNQ